MVSVGFVTLVSIRVESVTSTCLRSSFGDMTVFSAPMVPGSSGGWPGQISTTCGLSAARAGPITHDQVSKKTICVNRVMVAPLAALVAQHPDERPEYLRRRRSTRLEAAIARPDFVPQCAKQKLDAVVRLEQVAVGKFVRQTLEE